MYDALNVVICWLVPGLVAWVITHCYDRSFGFKKADRLFLIPVVNAVCLLIVLFMVMDDLLDFLRTDDVKDDNE